jgi:hypothetical protein
MSAAEQAVQLDQQAARELVDGIRAGLRTLDADVARAYHQGAAVALGYGSGAAGWAALCADLFADVSWLRPRLPEERTRKVAQLRREELSTRAIGAVLGVSPATVVTELRRARELGEELPDGVVSLDSRRRPATQPEQPVAPVAELPDLGLTELMHTALRQVWLAGDAGLTCLELQTALRWREGRCTSLLFRLRSAGLIGTDRAVRREDYAVHVATLPD